MKFRYFFYNNIPDIFTLCGALIIAISGTYVLIKHN